MKADTTAELRSFAPATAFRRPDALFVLTVIALAIGCALRLTRSGAPLWLDETFTGAIAAQPDLQSVLYQILQDINAPLYYLAAHFWSLAFGLSNQSLRFPAMICAMLAPFLCLIPAKGIPKHVSWVWCALTALWVQGFFEAQEARGYSLLLCFSIGTTLAFVRLLDEPSIKRAALWALLGSGAVLTHYDAVLLIGLQGVVYLVWHCGKAWRTWPAAFAFVPLCACLAIHVPRIIALSNPDLAWYPLMTADGLIGLSGFVVGSRAVCLILLAMAITAVVRVCLHRRPLEKNTADMRTAACAALIAFAGAALLVTMGFFRPVFAERYIVPFVPGLLLGLALAAESVKPYWRTAPHILIVVFIFGAYLSTSKGLPPAYKYNFEAASQSLLDAKTNHLVFLWDHPANIAENPLQLEIVADFFFHREGADIEVTPVQPGRDEDPNAVLLDAAKASSSDGLLWIYDTNIRHTAATRFPPNISALDPHWTCHDFGSDAIGVLACHRDMI